MLVNSVPLSETIVFGMPRSAITLSSSRATRCPDSDVSATRTKFSRLSYQRLPRCETCDRLSERQIRNPSSSVGLGHPAAPLASLCPEHAFDHLCDAPEASLHGRCASLSCGSPQNLLGRSSREYGGNQTDGVHATRV